MPWVVLFYSILFYWALCKAFGSFKSVFTFRYIAWIFCFWYNLGMNELIPIEVIENKIFIIRGLKVMLDSDLANLYEVETKDLNRAVKRNIERFPEKFMFQLTNEEWTNLRCQFVTSSGS